jgi:ABC-type transporter Mla subunit MlaD
MAKTQKGTRQQAAERADQLRSAVEDALQSAGSQINRERAQEIADELGSAVDRMRDAFDQLRPPTTDDLRRLVDRLTALERRVAALEIPGRPAAAKKPAAKKPAAKKPGAKKPAARKAANKPAARRSAR